MLRILLCLTSVFLLSDASNIYSGSLKRMQTLMKPHKGNGKSNKQGKKPTVTIVQGGGHCGGNLANPPQCASGFVCQPRPGNNLPFGDVGGICVRRSHKTPIACTMEARICPDGSSVGRNPQKGCAFDPCPTSGSDSSSQLVCIDDVFQCPDGSFVARDPSHNCQFRPCSGSSSSGSQTTSPACEGEPCGGNTVNPPQCATGLVCQPTPGSHLPFGDVGGTCVRETQNSNTAQEGEHCGGNTVNPPQCATGLVCRPTPGSHLPFGDVGGTCCRG